VFGAAVRQLRAELCALRGRYDDAAGELREARRAAGATSEVQFTRPMCYIDALIALGRGDLGAAREAVAAGLAGAPLSSDARYAWPLLWAGMRVAADEVTWFRDRREPGPGRTHAAVRRPGSGRGPAHDRRPALAGLPGAGRGRAGPVGRGGRNAALGGGRHRLAGHRGTPPAGLCAAAAGRGAQPGG
jgi:hypothetical protein